MFTVMSSSGALMISKTFYVISVYEDNIGLWHLDLHTYSSQSPEAELCFEYILEGKVPVFLVLSLTLVSKCTLMKLWIIPFSQITFSLPTKSLSNKGNNERRLAPQCSWVPEPSVCGEDESMGTSGWSSMIHPRHVVGCHPQFHFYCF